MNLFHSLLLIIGEIAFRLSVLVFLGAALAAFGEKFRSNRRVSTGARRQEAETRPGWHGRLSTPLYATQDAEIEGVTGDVPIYVG
jgi:hypothetical protein